MAHRDRVGGPSGRRKVAGDAAHRQNFFDALRRAAYATATAAYQGFRPGACAVAMRGIAKRARRRPKTLVSRLYGS